MTSELRPCPFCGYPAHIRTLETAHGSTLYSVACPTEGCYGFLCETYFDLLEQAVAAWNRRAERTCLDIGGEDGTNGELYDFACSACGYCCDLPDPGYCPGCGAKVVGK